ncbi:MAG: ThuA domain-containing protein [Phycisphaerae bacterium]
MKALVVYGGWDGHDPVEVSQVQADFLKDKGFDVTRTDSLDAYKEMDPEQLDLIVQHVTMSSIEKEQLTPLLDAVMEHGVGFAGIHGGVGDSFRQSCPFQFMVGGQWVAHPGNIIDYRVHIQDHADEVTRGLDHFDMHSEQYYMHVDPGNHVLATTTFECNGVTMPVAWKRRHGKGRVFYSSLGHVVGDLDVYEAREIMFRGMLWAAGSKKALQS